MTCPECGAKWEPGRTCQDAFHQMLGWEAEYPALTLEVHHLLVLCYHIQHPSLYSKDGLADAIGLLVEFVERGSSTQEVRRSRRSAVDSGKRTWKIKGTPSNHGSYAPPIPWRITAKEIVEDGVEGYAGRVRAWAQALLDDLKVAGVIAGT